MVVSTGDPRPVEIEEVAEFLPTITVPGQHTFQRLFSHDPWAIRHDNRP